MTNISAHTLVKNEAKFVWFSVMSVARYVDKIMIWDTGSTDGTLEIIKKIQEHPDCHGKLQFREWNKPFDEEKVRQEMLNETKTDWFLVVDADEIWWDQSIEKVTDFIRQQGKKYESIVTSTINLVGDIFHYQEKQAGQYNLAGKKGHYNLRGVNTSIPGLSSLGPHGLWGWVDEKKQMIQDRNTQKIKFLDAPYLHATHLPRAGSLKFDNKVLKRGFKRKHELGIAFPKDYYYPEVFFRPKPNIVPSPWVTMDSQYIFRAFFETPLRKLKRRLLPSKIGY